MKKNLVIKIPVKIPADLINATSMQLAGGTEKYLRGVLDGDPVISFETVAGYDSGNFQTNSVLVQCGRLAIWLAPARGKKAVEFETEFKQVADFFRRGWFLGWERILEVGDN
jgi:hypothetical protein